MSTDSQDLEKGADDVIYPRRPCPSHACEHEHCRAQDTTDLTACSTQTERATDDAYALGKITASVERLLSRVRVSSELEVTPPPDGGLQAWLQVLGAHLGMGSAWGTINTWSTCQTYYASTLLSDHSPTTISWIGSTMVTLTFFIGIFSGRLADAGYYYPLMLAGSFFQVLGLFTASFGTRFWHILLAQGLCFGFGVGLCFTPMTALLSTYFERKRSLATALGASGGLVAGIVYSCIFRASLSSIGFPWAMRILAFLVLAGNLGAATFLRWRLPPRTEGGLMDSSALKDKTWFLFVLGLFFVYWTIYFTFFYLGIYAHEEVQVDYHTSINVLLVMIGIGVAARVVCGILADRYTGALTMLIPIALAAAVFLFGWIGMHHLEGLYTFAGFYGWPSAAVRSLTPSALSALAPDLQTRGTRMGMAFCAISFAVVTGSPVAGALIARDHDHFSYAQIWGGVSMSLGAVFIAFSRITRTGLTWKGRF